MLNRNKCTSVPKYIVIISLSGLRERPKSATLAVKTPFYSITNTLRLLRSLWMMGGVI